MKPSSPLLSSSSQDQEVQRPPWQSRVIVAVVVLVLTLLVISLAVALSIALTSSAVDSTSGSGSVVEPCPALQENPFAPLANFCGSVPEINSTERAERRIRLSHELDAWNVSFVIMEPGASLSYLSGVSWGLSERPFLGIFFAHDNGVEQQPAWICPAFESRRASLQLAQNGFNISRLFLWQEHESFTLALGRAINASLHASRTFAFDRDVRYFVSEQATASLAINNFVVSAGDTGGQVVDNLRQIKSQAELHLLRCANIATKAVLSAVRARMEIGQRESDVRDMVAQALSTAGFVNIWYLVLFGPSASYPHGTDVDDVLREGEMVLLDIGGSMKGYQSDISRTFSFGAPGDQLHAYSVVKAAQRAAIDAIRPGVSAASIEQIARDIVVNGGFGPNYDFFTHRLGHGIGLQGHEAPYLVRGNNETILEEGMTFSVEPGIYVPASFGIRLEDIVTVTSDGCEVFGDLAS